MYRSPESILQGKRRVGKSSKGEDIEKEEDQKDVGHCNSIFLE